MRTKVDLSLVNSMVESLICWLLRHDYEAYEFREDVRLLKCRRCDKRWVMSDTYQALLRYDNDQIMMRDLKIIYPELEKVDF